MSYLTTAVLALVVSEPSTNNVMNNALNYTLPGNFYITLGAAKTRLNTFADHTLMKYNFYLSIKT